jgi:LPS O-antigen subunit length determinant protein (WzzB/FepE family)
VPPHRIIDARRWTAERLRFLESLLETDLTEEVRRQVHVEIESLRTTAARRRIRWLR